MNAFTMVSPHSMMEIGPPIAVGSTAQDRVGQSCARPALSLASPLGATWTRTRRPARRHSLVISGGRLSRVTVLAWRSSRTSVSIALERRDEARPRPVARRLIGVSKHRPSRRQTPRRHRRRGAVVIGRRLAQSRSPRSERRRRRRRPSAAPAAAAQKTGWRTVAIRRSSQLLRLVGGDEVRQRHHAIDLRQRLEPARPFAVRRPRMRLSTST